MQVIDALSCVLTMRILSMHKCAFLTAMNVLYRFGMKNNLIFFFIKLWLYGEIFVSLRLKR